MSKLEELGGLESAKEVADNPAEFLRSYVRGTILALIEQVESLTAERDQFQKLYEGAFNRLDDLERGEMESRKEIREMAEEVGVRFPKADAIPMSSMAADLIGTIESLREKLTEQLQTAGKRVEKLERDRASWRRVSEGLETKLQAARELAELTCSYIGRRKSFTARESQEIIAHAREFLKMLDG